MDIKATISGMDIPVTERKDKGNNLIMFPTDYCMIDLATTGHSPTWDHIIEIGAIRYSNGIAVDTFQSLVQPPSLYEDGIFIDEFVEQLTGITNEMLMSAPTTADAIRDFAKFLGDSIIVGYYVNYDVNFLYDRFMKYLSRPLTNDFVDVYRFARKLHPEMEHHRLRHMLELFGLTNTKENRTISDCEVTEICFELLQKEAIEKYGSEDDFARSFKKRNRSRIKAEDIVGDETEADPDNPLYHRYCAITGKLEKFSRTDAWQLIANLGGFVESGVTKKTNYLILGNNDYCASIKDGKSSKQKKAEALMLKGQDIEIIPESVFYDMLEGF